MFRHFAILFSVCLLTVGGLTGCAKPSLPEIGAITEVHGSPHIVQDNVCYYLGPWGPGATVLKIYYEETAKPLKSNLPGFKYIEGGDPYFQRITSIESEYIEEDRLHFYIPLLIESLKDTTQGGKGMRALSRLYGIISIEFPNGYGDYYMHPTKDKYTGTPFERDSNNRYPELDETTYNKWKAWWETEGHTAFP
ncbi:MAG: hypothetical protein OXU23_00900 [Candidatus Poribacteria bacterium]|nr:hypothetical protein [Candidatus Poribacteria bacterium]